MKNSAMCRKLEKKTLFRKILRLKKKIKDDGGGQQHGGDLQGFSGLSALKNARAKKAARIPSRT